MKVLIFLLVLTSFTAQASETIKCVSNGEYSSLSKVEILGDRITIEDIYHSDPDCKKPYQRDLRKGRIIEEQEQYVIILDYSQSFPLDDFQKKMFDEEPELKDELGLGPVIYKKSK